MNPIRKIFSVFCVLLLGLPLLLSGCGRETGDLKPLRLNEVVHSVFYAPQYVAMELGFFREEGLDLTVDIGGGADKCMTALLSNNADVVLCGTEAGIYVHAQGRSEVPMVIAQLTQRAGNFLVAREADPDFTWDSVRGKTIIGGRVGGMPEMVLEYILDQTGIKAGTDVEFLTNIETGSTAGAFAAGTGDYTTEFEPSATAIEAEGRGHVVASLGVESGYVPYTVYFASSDRLRQEPALFDAFIRAIGRGEQWCATHSAAEIAEAIQPQFSETSLDTLAAIVERYPAQATWRTDPVLSREALTLIQDILEFSGTLTDRIPYEAILYTESSAKE